METHKDFFGSTLNIGDRVAFCAPNYRHLTEGTIIKFTPKKVKVGYNNTWNYGKSGHMFDYTASPEFFIKKPTKGET